MSPTVGPVIAGSRGFALALLAPLTERIGTPPRIAAGAAQARPLCTGPGGLVVVEFLGTDTLRAIEALVAEARGVRIVAAVPEQHASADARLRALGVEVARWDGRAAAVVGAVGRQLAVAAPAPVRPPANAAKAPGAPPAVPRAPAPPAPMARIGKIAAPARRPAPPRGALPPDAATTPRAPVRARPLEVPKAAEARSGRRRALCAVLALAGVGAAAFCGHEWVRRERLSSAPPGRVAAPADMVIVSDPSPAGSVVIRSKDGTPFSAEEVKRLAEAEALRGNDVVETGPGLVVIIPSRRGGSSAAAPRRRRRATPGSSRRRSSRPKRASRKSVESRPGGS